MSILQELLESPSLHTSCGSAAKRATLKAKLTPSNASKQIAEGLKVSEGEDLLLEEAHVTVKGNLILEDQSRLLVAGDLEVEGNIIHEGFDYALLFVGGSLRADNLLFHGEVVVLGSITLRGIAWTYYNDYSTYADTLTARVVVADDREDAVDEVRADAHLTGHSSDITPKLGKLLQADVLDANGHWSYPNLAKRLSQREELLLTGNRSSRR